MRATDRGGFRDGFISFETRRALAAGDSKPPHLAPLRFLDQNLARTIALGMSINTALNRTRAPSIKGMVATQQKIRFNSVSGSKR